MHNISFNRGTKVNFDNLELSPDKLYFVSQGNDAADAKKFDSIYIGLESGNSVIAQLIATTRIDLMKTPSSVSAGSLYYASGSSGLSVLNPPTLTSGQTKNLTIDSSGNLSWDYATLPAQSLTPGTYSNQLGTGLKFYNDHGTDGVANFIVPKITVDQQGIITAISDVTFNMPSLVNVAGSTRTSVTNENVSSNGVFLNLVDHATVGRNGDVISATKIVGDKDDKNVEGSITVHSYAPLGTPAQIIVSCEWSELTSTT